MRRAPVPGPARLFGMLFPQLAVFEYVWMLRRVLAGCSSCLDVGCGSGSPLRLVPLERAVGVDAHRPSLEQARRNRTHHEYMELEATAIAERFGPGTFDAVVALDLIEHLSRGEGLALIDAMGRIARRKVVLFTPNGFLPQESTDGDLQEHRSGWSAGDFERLGFRVTGMHGHRALRAGEHRLRIRPRALGGVLAVASHHLYTRAHPEAAAALFCVRDADQPPSTS